MISTIHVFQFVTYIVLIPLVIMLLFSTFSKRIKPKNLKLKNDQNVVKLKESKHIIYHITKRTLSLIFAISGLLVFAPILVVICLLTLIEHGHCFSEKSYIGKGGQKVTLYKFQTTHMICNEPRISATGHFLRITSLDMMPRLINVIKGDIDLIGVFSYDRSVYNDYPDKIEKILKYDRPGFVNLSYIMYSIGEISNLNDVEEIMDYDLKYIANHNILTDVRLMIAITCTVFQKYNDPISKENDKRNKHNLKSKRIENLKPSRATDNKSLVYARPFVRAAALIAACACLAFIGTRYMASKTAIQVYGLDYTQIYQDFYLPGKGSTDLIADVSVFEKETGVTLQGLISGYNISETEASYCSLPRAESKIVVMAKYKNDANVLKLSIFRQDHPIESFLKQNAEPVDMIGVKVYFGKDNESKMLLALWEQEALEQLHFLLQSETMQVKPFMLIVEDVIRQLSTNIRKVQ